MPRGYYDGDGFHEVTGIANCTFEWLSPKPPIRAWKCRRCQRTMKLLPISKNEPAEFWECRDCGKKVTIEEHNKTFEECVRQLIQKYNLESMVYNIKFDSWSMVSNEWESIDGTRLNSHRKKLLQVDKDDIIWDFLEAVQNQLGIEISDTQELLLEE